MTKTLWPVAAMTAVMLWAPLAVQAETPPPAYAGLPADISDTVHYETYGEARFYPTGNDNPVVERGQHWHVDLGVNGLAENMEQKDVWAKIAPALHAAGWQSQYEADNNPYWASLRRQVGDAESWMYIEVFGSQDIRLDLVEAGTETMSLTLQRPGVTPETVSPDEGDFPYLAPLPGSSAVGGSGDPGSITVLMPGASDPQEVATHTIGKDYELEGMSTLQFVETYHNALVKAGWTIFDQSQGLDQTDATLTAHYGVGQRNLWAYLHGTPGGYSIRIGEETVDNLARSLDTDCHVALYGVLFDFNKATLRPESAPVLQSIVTVMQGDPALKIEIGGHTDNVGTAVYNQKLSQARAASVMAWLSANGVAPGRLSAVGYGLTQPVADNESEEGRAKNRRVEIAKPGCTAG